jgi:2-phosphosulfolactate phosphatase
MQKIHLILKKEEIEQQKISDNKIVVIFDILLATSTITSALQFGATRVIPVLNGVEAQKVASSIHDEDYLLVGEYQGKTIDGFFSPNPLELREIINGKSVILSTTNGTVAIKKSLGANLVYAASLLNSRAVVNHLLVHRQDETIVLVCSGSSNQFNIEDFYGAGYFIECLVESSQFELELTDSASAAHLFFQTNRDNGSAILGESRVGKKLIHYGYKEELEFVSQQSLFSVVPLIIDKNHIVNAEMIESKKPNSNV